MRRNKIAIELTSKVAVSEELLEELGGAEEVIKLQREALEGMLDAYNVADEFHIDISITLEEDE